METYIVKKAGWMEDGLGVSASRVVDEPLNLLPGQAVYLLLSGAIAVPPPVKAAKTPKGAPENGGN